MTIEVLDKGYLRFLDYLGDDLRVVNAARGSFGKEKTEIDDSDIRLLHYLARNGHESPFRHIQVQLQVKAPEVVARQWYKHVVGIETTSSYPTKDHAWNEISRRYVEIDDFYFPEVWRKQSTDNKQASEGEIDRQGEAKENYEKFLKAVNQYLKAQSKLGIAKEQYQIALPLSFYTEWYWTASFQAVMNFIRLRDHDHAQWEIRQYATILKDMMESTFPLCTKAWTEEHILFKKV